MNLLHLFSSSELPGLVSHKAALRVIYIYPTAPPPPVRNFRRENFSTDGVGFADLPWNASTVSLKFLSFISLSLLRISCLSCFHNNHDGNYFHHSLQLAHNASILRPDYQQ